MELFLAGGYSYNKDKLLYTDTLDKRLLQIANNRYNTNKILYIPFANPDYLPGIPEIKLHYETIGWDFNFINWNDNLEEKVKNFKVVYFGGGETKIYKNYISDRGINLKKLLLNKLVAGKSAGSNIFFKNSTSRELVSIDNNSKKILTSYSISNIILANFGPHYQKSNGRDGFLDKLVLENGLPGIGLDDCCAMHIFDKKCEIVGTKDTKMRLIIKDNNNDLNKKDFYDGDTVILNSDIFNLSDTINIYGKQNYLSYNNH